MHDVDARVMNVLLDEAIEDHAFHASARLERCIRDLTHQAGTSAAVHERVSAAGDLRAEGASGWFEARFCVSARPAEDRDSHAGAPRLPPRRF
jgi:hypothetical protein